MNTAGVEPIVPPEWEETILVDNPEAQHYRILADWLRDRGRDKDAAFWEWAAELNLAPYHYTGNQPASCWMDWNTTSWSPHTNQTTRSRCALPDDLFDTFKNRGYKDKKGVETGYRVLWCRRARRGESHRGQAQAWEILRKHWEEWTRG